MRVVYVQGKVQYVIILNRPELVNEEMAQVIFSLYTCTQVRSQYTI